MARPGADLQIFFTSCANKGPRDQEPRQSPVSRQLLRRRGLGGAVSALLPGEDRRVRRVFVRGEVTFDRPGLRRRELRRRRERGGRLPLLDRSAPRVVVRSPRERFSYGPGGG